MVVSTKAVRIYVLFLFVIICLVSLCESDCSFFRRNVNSLIIEPSDPVATTIYYLGRDQIENIEVVIERDKHFFENLFDLWKAQSQLSQEISLESFDVQSESENRIEMGSSSLIEYVPSPKTIVMSIEKGSYPLDAGGAVLESLVKTIRGAYFEDCVLTISVDGEVVYSDSLI